MYTILMLLTIVLVLILVFALIIIVTQIRKLLVSIGGDGTSFLAKLRLGLRAIETETGHLPVQVTKLNETLSKTGAGLKIVNKNLEETIQAALEQKNV
jgi:predicted PurR-regulated permease PerM